MPAPDNVIHTLDLYKCSLILVVATTWPFIDRVVGTPFSTGQKAVTSRWPIGTPAGAEFKMPTKG